MSTAAPRKRLNVGFLLAERFTLSAFANFVDVLRLASDEADRSRRVLCDWTVLSDTMDPVRSSCGVRVQPDTRLRHAGEYDYIAVVGGVMGDGAEMSTAQRRFLRDGAARGVPIIGLCTGVFVMQAEGLLKGYRCCVSWFHHQDFLDRFDTERPVSDQIFVVDRDRLTCSGGHGAAHLAAWLVDRHVGSSAALKSLNILMIDSAYEGARAQPGQGLGLTIRDDLVRRAVLKMQQNLAEPLSVDALARELSVARRTLERRFVTAIGKTPQKTSLELRLNRVMQLLADTAEPVADIAQVTGFCDASHLTRTLKAERNVTPAAFRQSAAPPR